MSSRICYPTLMGPNLDTKSNQLPNSDVAISEYEDGYNNGGLDVCNEFVEVANRELINRELVNLENAVVNIDNSNDVIIGPVTQFNVNGNVTIYQNKDGQPVEIEEKEEISEHQYKDVTPKVQKEDQEVAFLARKKCTFRIYLIGVLIVLLVSATAVILVFVLRKNTQEQTGTKLSNSTDGNSHRIIPREIWGARAAKNVEEMKTPVDLVVMKHSAGGYCDSFETCAKKLQTIQSEDVSKRNLGDIYFSFAIGGDGNAYYGRGWKVTPAFVKNSIDIVFLGNFAFDDFTPTMIAATKGLLAYGVANNYLTKNYTFINHNQLIASISPGKNVIDVVTTWDHYDPTSHMGDPLVIPTPTTPTNITL